LAALPFLRPLRMLERRLDDRIRSLSVEMVDAPKDELERILQELLSAIHEKMERLRSLAANRFLGRQHHKERRSTLS